jgi:polar amino acid transport system permease protein
VEGRAEPVADRRAERAAARRARALRGQAIAAVSSVVVLGGLALLILTSPGWPEVRDTFFDPEVFRESFPDIAEAFWLDIRVFCIVEVCVLILGLLVALIRTVEAPALFPLRLLAIVYADVFRGIPVILLVYLVGFGIPALDLEGLPSEPVVLGGIALTLSYTAYVSEVYRAGLRSVHRGQRDAALAIGLTEGQAMRHVILPQAVRRVGPPPLNEFIALQKDVALIAIIGVAGEAFRVAQIQAASDFNYTPLIAAALLYLAVTVPLARLLDRWDLERAR